MMKWLQCITAGVFFALPLTLSYGSDEVLETDAEPPYQWIVPGDTMAPRNYAGLPSLTIGGPTASFDENSSRDDRAFRKACETELFNAQKLLMQRGLTKVLELRKCERIVNGMKAYYQGQIFFLE